MTEGVQWEKQWQGNESGTCKENVSSVQRGALVGHFNNVQIQFLQSFFHDLCLNPTGKKKAQRQEDIETI